MFLIPKHALVLNIYNMTYVLAHVFFSMFDRFLMEQLSKVNPNHMNSDEQLAFWINLYNALIMHVSTTYHLGVKRLVLHPGITLKNSLFICIHFNIPIYNWK